MRASLQIGGWETAAPLRELGAVEEGSTRGDGGRILAGRFEGVVAGGGALRRRRRTRRRGCGVFRWGENARSPWISAPTRNEHR